jgi:hypothetical protein
MMAQAQSNKLYNQVIEVTTKYLGPASQRFVDRQIEAHLKKKPHQLTKADIARLADWVKIVIALLTEDDNTVDNYTRDLLRLRNQ